jgi:hypothetical protein
LLHAATKKTVIKFTHESADINKLTKSKVLLEMYDAILTFPEGSTITTSKAVVNAFNENSGSSAGLPLGVIKTGSAEKS